MTGKKRSSAQPYNAGAAGRFWSKRVRSTDPLSAVLSYGAPKELNRLYDAWERGSLTQLLAPNMRGQRALDIGAGIGRIALLPAQRGALVSAVDISGDMLARLARRARSAGLGNKVTTVQSPSHTIPLPDGNFDIITCFGLLEHLPEDVRKKTAEEISRLLRKSGRAYVVVNNTDNVFLGRSYPLKRQRSDGYFVTLVGLEWLRENCGKVGLTLAVKAANPWYGLLHYHLYPRLAHLGLKRGEFRNLCKAALRLEANEPLPAGAQQVFASHFLVELRHRKK